MYLLTYVDLYQNSKGNIFQPDCFPLFYRCRYYLHINYNSSPGCYPRYNNHCAKLEIRGLNGEVLCVLREAELTGLELKEKIYGITGIPPHVQRLFMGQNIVRNSSVVSNIDHMTIQLQVKAHGGGLTTPCGFCGVKEAGFPCTECHSMLLCSNCNMTWHDNNPSRQGHVSEYQRSSSKRTQCRGE